MGVFGSVGNWVDDRIEDVGDAVGDVAGTAADIAGGVVSVHADMLNAAGDAVVGIAEGVMNGVQSVGEFIGQYGELLTMLINPFAYISGQVLQYLMEIEWIKEPIDLLQGDTGPIEDLVNEWTEIGERLASIGQALVRGAKSSHECWEGDAGEKYRKIADAFSKSLVKGGGVARSAADRINTIGNLVAEARSDVIDKVFSCLGNCALIVAGALAASVISLGASIAAAITLIITEAVSTMSEIQERLDQLESDVNEALQGLQESERAFQELETSWTQAAANIRNPGSDASTPTPKEKPEKQEETGGGGGGSTGGGSGSGSGGGSGSGSGGGGGGQPEEEPEEEQQEQEPEVDDSEAAVTELPDGSKVLHPYLTATIPDEEWRQMAESIPREKWEEMAEDPESIPPELAKYAPDDLKEKFPSNDPDWEPPLGEDGRPKPMGAQIPADLVQYMTPGMDQAVEDFDMEAGKEAWEQEHLSEEQRLRDDLAEAETPEEKVEILERLDQIDQAEEAAEKAEEARESEAETRPDDGERDETGRVAVQPAPDEYEDALGGPGEPLDTARATRAAEPL